MATTVRQIDSKHERLLDSHRRRQAGLRGGARLMDIGGTLTVIRRRSSAPATVEDALASDWMRVGDSLRSALEQWKFGNAVKGDI